jgi:hypothetical protein
MKLKLVVVVFAVVVAWFAGHHLFHAVHVSAGDTDAPTFTVGTGANEQIVNDSYALSPGARVEVTGINGPVEIVTTESNVAEIHVENYVSDARDLEYHKITIEHGADFLTVRGENRGNGGWGFFRWLVGHAARSKDAHQRVVLKVPRKVEVATRGINGAVKIGELEGAVHVSGVNGAVTIARASGRAEVSGINGGVTLSVAQLADEGVRVSGVNGNIDLKLAADTNADLNVSGLSGSVTNDLKNATVDDEGDGHRSKFNARLGAGGAPIMLSGIHGDVHLATI